MGDTFLVLPIHKHICLLDECSEILNQQWPRSKAARNHSINKSTDTLPVSLAFVRCTDRSDEVLGFSKISAVQGIKDAGLVESVVLRKKDRGKGLGRVLMNLTEEYGLKLGIKTMFLSTKDKEGFYSHLGYEKCQPVLSLGANAHRVPEAMLGHFMTAASSNTPKEKLSHQAAETKQGETQIDKVALRLSSSVTLSSDAASSSSPPVVAPPPPPPPPPPVSNHFLKEDITRLDPNLVTWMKKDL